MQSERKAAKLKSAGQFAILIARLTNKLFCFAFI